jgi:hypothetical protein
MPHDDSHQEQLWRLIHERKQAGNETGSSSRNATTEESSEADALLVDSLYKVLRGSEDGDAKRQAYARALLEDTIARDCASAALPRGRRGFWRLNGKRELLLVAALLLITISAVAYVLWSARPRQCEDPEPPAGCPTPMQTAPTPKQTAPAKTAPTPAPVPDRSTVPSRGWPRALLTPTAPANTTTPHTCESPDAAALYQYPDENKRRR